jgi:hypothetical protein
LDIVVANGDSNSVSVLLGNGDGTFQPARNYAVGSDPYSVAVGDFRGNGILDIAVANEASDSVSVLLGNGDGTFRNAGSVSFPVGSHPYSVAVGNFYGDGIPALAVTGAGGTRVLRGNGDGTFQNPHVSYITGLSRAVASGDFHGDGLPDLAVTNGYYDRVFLLNNDGHGRGGRATPRGKRSPGALPRRQIEQASAGLLAQEAMQAAASAAAVPPPAATVRLGDDSRPLLGREAERLWASAARPGTISGNSVGVPGQPSGGGIDNALLGSTVTISDSAVINNTALNGGGIHRAGHITVDHSTISGNRSGGIWSYDFVELTDSTVADNTAVALNLVVEDSPTP